MDLYLSAGIAGYQATLYLKRTVKAKSRPRLQESSKTKKLIMCSVCEIFITPDAGVLILKSTCQILQYKHPIKLPLSETRARDTLSLLSLGRVVQVRHLTWIE